MEISKKRLLALAVLPVAVLLLSGCGKPASTNYSPTAPSGSQNAASTNKFNTPNPALQNTDPVTDGSAVQAAQLPPLPADNKQAIDQELSNIDKDLKTTDNSTSSTDLSNANLGL